MLRNKKVRLAMIEKDVSLDELARRCLYSKTYLSNVIKGRFRSARVEKAVADALGLPEDGLWDKE